LNAEFTRIFHDMFDPAQAARFQGNFQTVIENSVGKSRESYDKAAEYAKENMRTIEQAVVAAQASGKQIGEKFFRDAEASAKSFFDTASAMARAKTISEIAGLQAEFVQQQVEAMGEQSKAFFEFSSKFAQQMFETVGSTVSRTERN
jgi:hypothetical protein